MSYYGLTDPVNFNTTNINEKLKQEYDYLYNTFLNEELRPKLKGEFIFIKNEFIAGMYERFLHSISLEDKQYYKGVLPCNNEETSIYCITKCKIQNASFIFQNLKRVECLYRLSRIHWIPEIIDYANNENGNIRIWRNEKKDKTNDKWVMKRYLRYKNKLADFVIIFNEIYDKAKKDKFKFLDFRTAYPIFLPRDKVQFDKEYFHYIKSKK